MRRSGVHLDEEVLNQVQRRREERFACVKPVYIRPFAQSVDEKFLFSRLLDCSAHGVCVLTPRPMQPKEQFLLKLRFERLALVLYTVRSCSKGDYANWRIGAEFGEIIGLSEINPGEFVRERLIQMPTQVVKAGVRNAP